LAAATSQEMLSRVLRRWSGIVELSSEEASPGDGKISEGVPRGGPSAS
ncbi:hypothetical protein TNCT_444181, partial [Trichonephila clavata]